MARVLIPLDRAHASKNKKDRFNRHREVKRTACAVNRRLKSSQPTN